MKERKISKQKYYKTIITVEILSDFPYDYGFDLGNIQYDMTYGDVSGRVNSESKEITKNEIEALLIEHGGDPSFIFGDIENN
jgi:hypothetical protein